MSPETEWLFGVVAARRIRKRLRRGAREATSAVKGGSQCIFMWVGRRSPPAIPVRKRNFGGSSSSYLVDFYRLVVWIFIFVVLFLWLMMIVSESFVNGIDKVEGFMVCDNGKCRVWFMFVVWIWWWGL